MLFDVKAMGASHEVLAYTLEASDEADARRLILEQGRRVISLHARQALMRVTRRRRLPLVQFSEELVALLDAAIPVFIGMTQQASYQGNSLFNQPVQISSLMAGMPCRPSE